MNEKRIEPRIEVVYDYKKEAAKTGVGTVWVRCYFTRTQRKYISTGVRVKPEEWSARWWVVGRPDAAALNIKIKEQYNECMRMTAQVVQNQIMIPSAKDMKTEHSASSFLDFMGEQIEKENISKGTKAHHESTLNLLLQYGKIRKFEQVNSEAVEEWMRWVAARGIRQITVHDHWKRLRKYIRIAQRKGKIPFNAVSGVSVKRGEAREREHLTDKEIKKWINKRMPLPYLEATRDRFIVQMGTGLAYADMLTTDFSRHEKVGDMETISSTRVKTGKRCFIVILPMAVKVLQKWGWKVPPISNQKYNTYLDRVAILCGINKHITSHVGRHTYACQCLAHGVRLEAVQRTLGHSSIKTTQIYARMMDMDVVDSFNKSNLNLKS